MAEAKFYRGVEESIPQTLEDGAIYLATDTGELSIDTDSNRFKYSSNVGRNTSAGYHNCIYRGKYLGDTFDMKDVSDGDFGDLFIGDYWTLDDVNYRIAGFDHYYNNSNNQNHHVVLLPDEHISQYELSSGDIQDNYTSTALASYVEDNIPGIINSNVRSRLINVYRQYRYNAQTGYVTYAFSTELLRIGEINSNVASETYDTSMLPLIRYANQFKCGSEFGYGVLPNSASGIIVINNNGYKIQNIVAPYTLRIRPIITVQ